MTAAASGWMADMTTIGAATEAATVPEPAVKAGRG
jgi:hypothetical protein